MRSRSLLLAMVVVATFAACRNRETALTGSYGSSMVTGQVVMSDDVANGSPAGVQVSVVGTGMATTLGADGRFTFIDVPENAQLLLQRADGINATIRADGNASMTIRLGQTGAASSSRRRGAAPKREFEGVIRSVNATQLVMFTSHREEVTIAIDDLTIIRKGNTTLTPADLKVDDRIHVKATLKDNVLTALEIKRQNPADEEDEGDDDDDAGQTMTANGLVLSQSGTELVVQSQPKGDVTVRTDGNTIIKRQGDRIAVTDIKAGDEVNCMGQRVNDTTLLARQIEVRGKSKGKGK